MKTFSSFIVLLLVLVSDGYSQTAQSEDFSFVFMTDIHLKNEPLVLNSYRKVINQINEISPDFVLSGGDQVYDVMRGNEPKSDSLFSLFIKESKAIKAPIYPAVGNHELFGIYEESPSDSSHHYYKLGMYEKYFGKPYYSFDHKGWHFIVLNSLDVKGYKYIESFDQQQLSWLSEDLKTISPTTPIVIMTHIPLVSVQNQMKEPKDGISYGPSLVNKYKLFEILKPYNLKLVLQGHIHYFEDIMVDGKTRFISGGAVAGRPSWKGLQNGPRGFLSFKTHGDDFSYSFIDYEDNKEIKF